MPDWKILFLSFSYFVLLILTDGIISDMAQTKEAIVNVSILHMQSIYLLTNVLCQSWLKVEDDGLRSL
jgi:hypothetical protein